MTFKLKYVPYLIIAVMLVIILLQRECKTPCPDQPGSEVKDSIITKYDTILKDTVIYKPKPVYVHDSVPGDTVWFPLTDSAVIADYNKVRDYDIPLRDDSVCKLSIEAKVYQNSLVKAKLKGQVVQKTVTIIQDHYIEKPARNKIYLGFQAGAMLPDKFIFAPSAAFNTKRDHLYLAGYDPINKTATVSFLWKIRLSRYPD